MFDSGDMLKAAALHALLEKMEEAKENTDSKQKKYDSLVPHFDTESEAINYARRVAAIKAGDVVKLPIPDGERLVEVVYTGTCDPNKGAPQFLVYDVKSKRLASMTTSWHAVVL